MRYLSDSAAQVIPALRDAEDKGQVLEDAGALLDFIRSNEFVDDARLRRHAEQRGVGPDRVNAAISVLREGGQLHVLPETTTDVLPSDNLEVRRAALEAETLEALQPMAAELAIEGRSSMNKPELIDAILAAQDAGLQPSPAAATPA